MAAGLLEQGHPVVLACRSRDRCEAARQRLQERCPAGPSARCGPTLDLEDYQSIRAFSRDLEDEPISVLVNNAGVMGVRPPEGGDGDAHLRPNHLGPYLFTRLLLPRMAAGGRVVTVGSQAHRRGQLAFDSGGDLPPLPAGDGLGAYFRWYPEYGRSKLANLLFTAELTRRLHARGSSVTATCVSPGRVGTSIFNNVPALLRGPLTLLSRAAFQTPAQVMACTSSPLAPEGRPVFHLTLPLHRSLLQGARTVLRAATAPELAGQSTLYMHAMQPMEPSAAARDERLAEQLWHFSNRQVGLSDAEDRDICWPNS